MAANTNTLTSSDILAKIFGSSGSNTPTTWANTGSTPLNWTQNIAQALGFGKISSNPTYTGQTLGTFQDTYKAMTNSDAWQKLSLDDQKAWTNKLYDYFGKDANGQYYWKTGENINLGDDSTSFNFDLGSGLDMLGKFANLANIGYSMYQGNKQFHLMQDMFNEQKALNAANWAAQATDHNRKLASSGNLTIALGGNNWNEEDKQKYKEALNNYKLDTDYHKAANQ